jgi:hypothetical protein
MKMSEVEWVEDGDSGYALALRDGELICRNAKGQELKSVPKKVKDGELGQELLGIKGWLEEHEAQCLASVEGWMMRSLPVSKAALAQVWRDLSWRAVLQDAILAAEVGASSEACGFFKGVDAERGLGVVNLDGESVWLDVEQVVFLHPTLLEDLSDWRELAIELGINQRLSQLYRETFVKPAKLNGEATSVDDYAGGEFAMLQYAVGRARRFGYKVSGGFASVGLWEAGRRVEARYWIGEDAPDDETQTGDLLWMDEESRVLKLAEVGPVAYSEGMRMASLIWAGRKVEEKSGEEQS